MRFESWGRLRVEGDRALALGSPQPPALLAVLLVHRGEPVSSDRLIDELWGEQAPASAIKIVQGYVSNLRKALGDGLLVTRGRGYSLQAEPGQLDVDRFESLVAEGRRALHEGDAGQIVKERFVLVHVDIGEGDKNLDLAKKYKTPLDKGVPAVAILKGDGTLLYSSGDGEFESARTMMKKDLKAFLQRWNGN